MDLDEISEFFEGDDLAFFVFVAVAGIALGIFADCCLFAFWVGANLSNFVSLAALELGSDDVPFVIEPRVLTFPIWTEI